MRRMLSTALLMTVLMTILTGLAYPLAMTGFAQVAFPGQANGSLVTDKNHHVVGSSLIGQSFLDASGNALTQYFQPRPSAAGAGYDAMASGGDNLGPTNPDLISLVNDRVTAYRLLNHLTNSTKIPVDAVTTSASGLDPDISIANARLQAPRVATVRHLALAVVLGAVASATNSRALGILGQPAVNVLELNEALDQLSR